MKSSFFQDPSGNDSSSRLIAVIVIIWALVLATAIVVIRYIDKDADIVLMATASGLVFTTIAGPALAFLFWQKKEEGKQEEVKQNLTAKVENPDNKNLTDIKT